MLDVCVTHVSTTTVNCKFLGFQVYLLLLKFSITTNFVKVFDHNKLCVYNIP